MEDRLRPFKKLISLLPFFSFTLARSYVIGGVSDESLGLLPRPMRRKCRLAVKCRDVIFRRTDGGFPFVKNLTL